jgi:FixJ family two-component response regulator
VGEGAPEIRAIRKDGSEWWAELTATNLLDDPDVGGVVINFRDVTEPEMSGAEIFDALRAIVPDVRVLLASGFAAGTQSQDLLERGCADFIQKPFSLKALGEKVKALI